MMTFQNDDGQVLNVRGKIFLNKRSVSFFTSSIQGDYSVNFDVDNNSETRKVLNYDGPMMLNQVAFTRQPFTLMRNGNPFIKGNIVIQNDNGKTLSCFFLSGNSNWINLLNGLITELDFSGVTNGTDYEFILGDTGPFLNATSGHVYPIVDWAFGLNKGWNDWDPSEDLTDVKADPLQSFVSLYPCFYLHTLVDEIVKQKGLKIGGSVLGNQIYRSLVISPVNGQIKRPNVFITSAYGTTQSTTSTAATGVQYVNFTDGSDPEAAFENNTYTAPRNAKVIVTLTIVTSTVPLGTILQVQLFFNGVAVVLNYETSAAVSNVSQTLAITLTTGSTITARFRNNGLPGTVSTTLNIKFDVPTQITSNDYLTPDLFLPALTCLDVIKFVINYFGCVSSYDEYSKTILINQVELLDLSDAEDWSAYYNSHTTNYTIDTAENNYQRLAPPDDATLKAYNKGRTVKYGEGNITTENTLKENNDLLRIPFAPSDFGLGKNGIWNTTIPLIELKDAGEAIPYQSISNVGGRNSYNYTFDYVFTAPQLVRIVDDNDGDLGIFSVNQTSGIGIGNVEFTEIPFSGVTGTGKLYLQEIVYKTIAPRILINKPETLTTDFSQVSSIRSSSAVSFAFFAKKVTGFTIDNFKASAAFDNPDVGISDPSINQLYFGKIASMIGNPQIPIRFTLPESVFQGYKFDRFIYVATPKLTGYFFPAVISNYSDGNTPVEVNMYMI